MIENIFSIDDLRSSARARSRSFITKSVNPKLVDEELKNGWSVLSRNKTSVRLSRDKQHGIALEDRVWSLLYKMRFDFLSGNGGAKLRLDARNETTPTNQIDIVGIDNELAIAIECKSSEKYSKRSQFQEELAKFSQFRERFIRSVNGKWPATHKRQAALLFFLNNINLTDNDRERAKSANVFLFDEKDLEYYENLVSHLGPAAKYQFLADMLPGKTIPGLAIRVPAVKTKIGPFNCYTFPVSPEYLLKISYVSHRSKGKASDIHTYQRMLSKSRLKKIRNYISDKGIFPTNIVVNLEKKCVDFQKIKQENTDEDREASGILGWLDIKPAYKSAWIIDGQHRLFAYSGHPLAHTGHLSVLAFEGIPPSTQAKLFIDINAKQKSVKPSLLQELFAELHWDADSPSVRTQAIISKAVQVLDSDKDSPFYGRIQTADATKDDLRCISLTTIYRAIEKQGFFIVKEMKGSVVEYGPLWAVTNEDSLSRLVYILNKWFGVIRSGAPEWWDLGMADGGGLAMNDSIAACINVLKSIFSHLETKGKKLLNLDNSDLGDVIKPYAEALAKYFGSLSADDRKRYRELRGSQGQTRRAKRCQQAIKAEIPSFNPSGLDDFIRREKEQTNLRAKEIIDRIERELKEVIVGELKQEFYDDENSWWLMGVPKQVRLDVTNRQESDDNKRGSRDAYFELIDYRKIILQNWTIFQNLLGYGKKSDSKDKQTKWIVRLNELRNYVSHPSSGITLSIEDLVELEQYEQFLRMKDTGADENEEISEDAEAESS